MGPVARPRLYWPDFSLRHSDGFSVQEAEFFDLVVLEAEPIERACWVANGWTWPAPEGTVLPTFTRAIRRARPPFQPAGLAHTGNEARLRWEADGFRFPPHTYKEAYCLQS